jgi:uncharacterized membrane protein
MRLKDLTLAEQLVLALSLILLCMLIVDPLMLEQAKALPQGVRKFFRTITDIGKSNWMLIPTGTAVALALVLRQRYGGWRNAAAYGLIASTIGFVFVSIGGAKLIANLTKNILGRARPKLFETAGPIDFNFFAFDPDYASIAASRVLIGQHYVTDVVLGAILGTVFPYWVRDRFAARRWLFERTPDGGYRLRGVRTQRWLGWPPIGQPAPKLGIRPG